MKKLTLILISLFVFSALFGQVDSKTKIFDKNSKITGFDFFGYKRFTPTKQEVASVDSLAAIYIANNSASLSLDKKAIDNYQDYYKQVYGIINKKGEKVLFVNSFCKHKEYWKQTTVSLKGGGSCYFSFKVNLNDYKFFDFWVNAPK